MVWAWLNYSWFASAYDTDDWVFASLDHGDTLDNHVMVAGYVVMRIPLIFLWWQVARHDPDHAPGARIYMATIAFAQAGWVLLAILDLPIATTFALFGVLLAVEFAGPFAAERKVGTPWHPRHIAERYGLLVIITLGEAIIGTVAALNAVVHGDQGWTSEAVALTIAGVGLTGIYAALMRTRDPFHLLLLAVTGVILALAVVTVVGYETIGHRHMADALDQL